MLATSVNIETIFATFYLSINFYKMMLLHNPSNLKFNVKISFIYFYEFWIIFNSLISVNQVNTSLVIFSHIVGITGP